MERERRAGLQLNGIDNFEHLKMAYERKAYSISYLSSTHTLGCLLSVPVRIKLHGPKCMLVRSLSTLPKIHQKFGDQYAQKTWRNQSQTIFVAILEIKENAFTVAAFSRFFGQRQYNHRQIVYLFIYLFFAIPSSIKKQHFA